MRTRVFMCFKATQTRTSTSLRRHPQSQTHALRQKHEHTHIHGTHSVAILAQAAAILAQALRSAPQSRWRVAPCVAPSFQVLYVRSKLQRMLVRLNIRRDMEVKTCNLHPQMLSLSSLLPFLFYGKHFCSLASGHRGGELCIPGPALAPRRCGEQAQGTVCTDGQAEGRS